MAPSRRGQQGQAEKVNEDEHGDLPVGQRDGQDRLGQVHAEKNAEALVIEEDAALGAAVIGQVHHAVAQRAPGQVADAVKCHADAHQQQRHPHTDRVHHDALGHKLDLPPVGEARGWFGGGAQFMFWLGGGV